MPSFDARLFLILQDENDIRLRSRKGVAGRGAVLADVQLVGALLADPASVVSHVSAAVRLLRSSSVRVTLSPAIQSWLCLEQHIHTVPQAISCLPPRAVPQPVVGLFDRASAPAWLAVRCCARWVPGPTNETSRCRACGTRLGWFLPECCAGLVDDVRAP